VYLTDFRENTLQDVITKIEPDLFETGTGLTVKDFHLLVRLKAFNTEQMIRPYLHSGVTRMPRCAIRASKAMRGCGTMGYTTRWWRGSERVAGWTKLDGKSRKRSS